MIEAYPILDQWFYSLSIELLFRASVKGKLGLACFNQLPGLLTRLYHQFCFLICSEYSSSFIYINLYLYLLSFFFLLLIKRQNFRLCFCLGLISSGPFIGPTVALVGFQILFFLNNCFFGKFCCETLRKYVIGQHTPQR